MILEICKGQKCAGRKVAKMTDKDALNAVERIVNKESANEFYKWMTAGGIIKRALKKQIAEKPSEIKTFDGKIESANCPCCGYSFPDIGGVNESYFECEQYNYCPDCGQKIEWSDI